MDRSVVSEMDLKMMKRCVELSKTVRRHGEFPLTSLVCNGEVVVSEAINHVDRDAGVTRHGELMAVSEAQRMLGRNEAPTPCTCPPICNQTEIDERYRSACSVARVARAR
jgi:tRNA(Arg) A34 adenosine deaminase TadA